jgi:hypothetical protein
MKALIRNCAHQSNVFMTLETNDEGTPTAIYKSSSGEGISHIRQELEGFNWYNEQSENKVNFQIERDEDSYFRVKFDFIDGETFPLKRGVLGNADPILATIKHYIDIWGKFSSLGKGPLHGDFCLGNTVFVDSNPVMMDWEHFHPDGVPIGFDALFSIYLSLWFECENRFPKERTLSLIAKMISLLIQHECLNNCLAETPLKSMINFIKENRTLWGAQSEKIPMLMFNKELITFVDEKVLSMMR